ncbi:MAG: hypothetical protein JRJ20_05870 [Deltaproteobacteria bacterium]|nr:hypothetical protein [Deltaproteobacteria bacterium]
MSQEISKAVERVRAAFDHHDQQMLVRGELWVGKRPFQEFRIDDSLAGHLSLRNRLGMDLLFLPVSVPDFSFSSMDYQRFSVAEIEEAVKISDLFVAVIADGPFQRLVEKRGLLPLLTELKDDEKAVAGRFEEEAADMAVLLKQCLELNVGAVVVADDLAFQDSTYISPGDSEKLLGPLYSDAVAGIHAGGAYALFHSCGNITAPCLPEKSIRLPAYLPFRYGCRYSGSRITYCFPERGVCQQSHITCSGRRIYPQFFLWPVLPEFS